MNDRYNREVRFFTEYFAKEGIPIEDVTYIDMLAFVQDRQKQVSISSIKKNVCFLKSYFNSIGIVPNPCEHITIQGKDRVPIKTNIKWETLTHIYKEYNGVLRNKVMLGLYVFQGITPTEIQKLRKSHLDLGECIINVPETTKGNSRTLKLEAQQLVDLIKHIETVEDTLFYNSQGGKNFQNINAKLFKHYDFNVREVRGARIREWLKSKNLREVQYLSGLRYISSVERYIEVDLEELKGELEKYHPY